jgi:hypothetical protein
MGGDLHQPANLHNYLVEELDKTIELVLLELENVPAII